MPADEVDRPVMPSIASTSEPNERVGIVTLVVSNLAKTEHRARVATTRRIAIPSAGALNVARNAYAVEVEPAHRKNRVGVARLRCFGVERKSKQEIRSDPFNQN